MDKLIIDKDVPKVFIRICEECWMPYGWKVHDGGRKPKYCSDACRKIVMRRQQQGHKTIPKECVVCSAVFLTDKWKAKTKKFCSTKCQYAFNSKHGGSREVPCDVCAKIIKRNPGKVGKKNYCGYECMAIGKTLDAPRTNGWANVRAWFSRFGRMKECARCKYNEQPGILVLHHKDRDRQNNALSNLEVLCPNCHALEHMAENKINWKGHDSTNPVKVKLREANRARKKNASA